MRGVPEGYTPSKTRERKGIEAQIRTLKHKATTLPVQAAAIKIPRVFITVLNCPLKYLLIFLFELMAFC